MNYKDVISAEDRMWKSEARKLMENGSEFVVIHVAPEQIRDCKAWVQEFDYTLLIEDRPFVVQDYPDVLPSKLGFVKRRASGPDSRRTTRAR